MKTINRHHHLQVKDLIEDLKHYPLESIVFTHWHDTEKEYHQRPIYKTSETADKGKVYLYLGDEHIVKIKRQLWRWEPFTYICEGFDGEKEELGGFFPADVRAKCSFNIKRIHGPIVKGFWSWCIIRIIGE